MSSLFALFLVTSLANILTPGLGVVMIITLAAEYGWRRTMSGALGTALGIAFLFIAGMSGVSVIVASSPMLFAAIKLLGACFLIWLSLKLPCLKTEYSLRPSDSSFRGQSRLNVTVRTKCARQTS